MAQRFKSSEKLAKCEKIAPSTNVESLKMGPECQKHDEVSICSKIRAGPFNAFQICSTTITPPLFQECYKAKLKESLTIQSFCS